MMKLIDSAGGVEEAVATLSALPLVALDTETRGLDPHRDKVVLLQAGNDQIQFIFDCRTVDIAPLKPLLTGPTPKVLHNAKFDYKMLRAHAGARLEQVVDTMLIEQVLMNGRPQEGLGLKDLAWKYLGETLDKEERLSFLKADSKLSRRQLDYAARDVAVTYRVLLEQMDVLKMAGLERTARLECQAVPAFGDLEFDGILLDVAAWRRLIGAAEVGRDDCRRRLDKVFRRVRQTDLFGNLDLNYDSDEQVKEALRALGLEVEDTSRHTLSGIDHEVIEPLLQYRQHQKVITTYGEGFLAQIHPGTGRIHPDFRQIGASTGRVSCSRPNLQNIKRGDEFRSCFIAPEGSRIITADYSGCELRIIAELSDDPGFIETFQRGGDLHAMVASAVFDLPVSKESHPELRNRAKAINFGLAYGMGAAGLARVIDTPLAEAEKLLRRYFDTYPRINEYLEQSAITALARGYAETIGGRRLYLEGEDEGGELTRLAKNMPIQGTNADMTKLALTGIRRRLLDGGLDARIVNTIHDEIVVECDAGQADEVATLVRHEMVRAGEAFLKKAPVEVDLAIGDCWGH